MDLELSKRTNDAKTVTIHKKKRKRKKRDLGWGSDEKTDTLFEKTTTKHLNRSVLENRKLMSYIQDRGRPKRL